MQKTYIDKIKASMPELPDVTRLRLQREGLSARDSDVLMSIDAGREVGIDGDIGSGAVAYFDAISKGRDPKVVVNW
jgi:aspartyl-tRNA(Asn)/glutamyl-tRNA(Gln) amidotransferase subunit B